MAESRGGKTNVTLWTVRACVIVALAASCGPPLAEPSSEDVTGTWATSDSIGPLSAVQISMTQGADGTLTGQWSGKLFPPDAACPPGLGANPNGPITGNNTVFEVRFDINGAGIFEGQLEDSATLKGSVESCGGDYQVVLKRTGPVSPP